MFASRSKVLTKRTAKNKEGVDNTEMITETSKCTVCVLSKIENATNLQKFIAYTNVTCNLKPACFSTDRDFFSVFTSCSSDLTFLTLKEKS